MSKIIYLILLSSQLFTSIAFAEIFEGKFLVDIVDNNDGSTQMFYNLTTDKDEFWSLNMESISNDNIPETGARVRLEGERVFNDTVSVSKIWVIDTEEVKRSGKRQAGERKLIFLRANDSVCQKSQIENLGERLHDEGSEFSIGNLVFSGDLNNDNKVDVFTFPHEVKPFECNFTKLRRSAKKHLKKLQAQFDYTPRSNYSLILFTEGGCPFGGRATIGGNFILMNNCSYSTFQHEIGHNLGAFHSSMDKNKNGTIDFEDEYADSHSIMGNGYLRKGFNPVHLEQFGWLKGDQLKEIRIENREEHKIVPRVSYDETYNQLTSYPKFFKVTGGMKDYYISLFQVDNLFYLQVHHKKKGDKRSLLHNSVMHRQSLAITRDLWITFAKMVDGVASFSLSSTKPEGFGSGRGKSAYISDFGFLYSHRVIKEHFYKGRYTMIYPWIDFPEKEKNVSVYQIFDNKIHTYFSNGTSKIKSIQEVKKGEYGRYKVSLPGSSEAINHQVGDVLVILDGDEKWYVSVRSFTDPYLSIYFNKTLSSASNFKHGYLSIKKLNDEYAEIIYSKAAAKDNKQSLNSISSSSSATSVCVDSDGDGWGWNGKASCVATSSSSASLETISNENKHSFSGFSSSSSYFSNSSPAKLDCVDSDGDGWGWDGQKSCKVEQ